MGSSQVRVVGSALRLLGGESGRSWDRGSVRGHDRVALCAAMLKVGVSSRWDELAPSHPVGISGAYR